jgi:hypothetical protein
MHLPAGNTAGVITELNPYLQAYRQARPVQSAGAGQVFAPSDRDLIMWQTRPAAPSEYERTLADGLEQIFGQRIYEPADIAAALNREGLRTPGGELWTERNFQETFRELGKLAFG